MFFDSHAHFDDDAFSDDRAELLGAMKENGIDHIINIGASMSSSRQSVALAEKYDFMYAAVGIHPHDADSATERDMEELRQMLRHEKVVAVGEIGLDYHYDFSDRDSQRKWFRRQMELAAEEKMPFIIHEREACRDTLDILKASDLSQGGVFHCFSGSVETAEIVLGMGLYLSFGGVITFKNAQKAVEVVKMMPMDRLLIETDCPYLTPVPFRGKRNNSMYVKYVAEKIAEIRGMTTEEVARITAENTKRLFRIEESK